MSFLQINLNQKICKLEIQGYKNLNNTLQIFGMYFNKIIDNLRHFDFIECLTFLLTLMLHNIPAYPRMAENTNRMQDIIQVDIAENPSTFGDIAITELNMLINTRNSVTSKDILPATI